MSAIGKITPSEARHWLEKDWKLFGPGATAGNSMALEEAQAYCRRLALTHYENFSIASCLIPSSLRQHFYNVYAYCRWSDDLADESASTEEAIQRLEWWKGELERCFQGMATHPVMIGLRQTVSAFQLDKRPFEDLLSAFLQDQFTFRYETEADLLDYCRRSANPVGRILLSMAKVDDVASLALSDRVCTGLQLANFCQDMQRDRLINRIYFPRSAWDAFGIDEEMILAGQPTAELRRAVLDWASRIRPWLEAGAELSRRVPPWLSRDIRLFAGGGLLLLERIEKQKGDVWTRRPTVTRWNKLVLLAKAMLPRSRPWVVLPARKALAPGSSRHEA